MQQRLRIYCMWLSVYYVIAVQTLKECAEVTESCPKSEAEWNQRRLKYNCTEKYREYTCLQGEDGVLCEACILGFTISPNTTGCPYIVTCDSMDGPLIGTNDQLKRCSPDVDGCPKEIHVGYSVHEMYKYPACLHQNVITLTTSYSHAIPTSLPSYTVHNSSKASCTILCTSLGISGLTALVISLILFFGSIVLYIKRRNKFRRKRIRYEVEEESSIQLKDRQEAIVESDSETPATNKKKTRKSQRDTERSGG